MNEQANREYIAYRLNRSRESLEEARLLADNRHLAGAINRIYYAMFYAVSALALSHGFSTSSHAQLRGYFNREFVRAGRVSIDLGRAFGTAFDSRSKGDYEDLVQFDAEQVSVMLVEAQQFVHTVSRLVVNP